jgi:release factor glutamine methyltransferase
MKGQRVYSYSECYLSGKNALEQAGIHEASLDARLLLEYVCHTNRNDLLAHKDREVENAKVQAYESCIGKRVAHMPLQYITGEQDFMGLTFRVTPHVLIPRQDTEILAEEVLREACDGMRILDMCTGSGCILISLLYYTDNCCGIGTDISGDALSVANENAQRLLKNKNVSFAKSGLFDDFHNIEGKFDIIVSNPPYIKSGEIATLMPEVRDFEPRLALDGRDDGLFYHNRIIPDSRGRLVRGGRLYLEVGYDQGAAVSARMAETGFEEVEIIKDLAGLDRVVTGYYWGKAV